MSDKSSTDKTGLFYDFQKLCNEIANENSYNEKTAIVARFLKTWKGDVYLVCKLLLAREDHRVFNIREKQMAKYLSRALDSDYKDILEDLEKGDMSQTAKDFLESSGQAKKRSTMTLKEVDDFLDKLTTVTKEDDQYAVLEKILERCTGDDIKFFWKLMDHDLKINIGAKFVLTALHPKAFDAFKNSNNLKMIVERCLNHTLNELTEKKEKKQELVTSIQLGLPVKPMLARAVSSTEEAFTRSPSGILYAEIKYDGERLQIHKQGEKFSYFSRNLKPVRDYKVAGVTEYLPKATDADSIILDGEILLMDTKNRKPLPFGTLGIHKKTAFKDATVCVFIFDILYIDGKSLMSTPLAERRKILEENVNVIPNHIELSERKILKEEEELAHMMTTVIHDGLEGLVIKDSKSIYEPGARHWLKLKKDYVQGMADSADLLVLGAYFGTGSRGGIMGSFLMGCYDEDSKTYKTVCKVANGFDDETLDQLQKSLSMNKINKEVANVPKWLDVAKALIPDFVCKDPKKTQVWEIEGNEFSVSTTHTAKGYSIRFPRMVKIRDDKDWASSTTLQILLDLVENSSKDFKMKAGKTTKKKAPKSPPRNKPAAKKTKGGKASSEEEEERSNEDISEEEEEEEEETKIVVKQPVVKKPVSTALSVTVKNKISYVENGDVTEPIGGTNKIIVNFADNSGKWGKRGLFAAISNRFGTVAEDDFNKKQLKLGDFSLVQVEDKGKYQIFVGTLAVQVYQNGAAPPFDKSAFDEALVKLVTAAKEQKASVHFPMYANITGMDWEGHIEKSLRMSLIQHKIPVYVYSTNKIPSSSSSSVPAKPVAQPQKRSIDLESEEEKDEEVKKPIVIKKQKVEVPQLKTVRTKALLGIRAVFSGFADDAILKEKLKALGGIVQNNWIPFGSNASTHLICSSLTEDFQHVYELGGLIVKESWLEQCFELEEKLDEKLYIFDPNAKAEEPMEIEPTKPKTTATNEPLALPSVFADLSIYLHKCEKQEQLFRYIIAFDGDVTGDVSEASHIVTDSVWNKELEKMLQENKKLKIVKSSWAWECITTQFIQSEKAHFVKRVL